MVDLGGPLMEKMCMHFPHWLCGAHLACFLAVFGLSLSGFNWFNFLYIINVSHLLTNLFSSHSIIQYIMSSSHSFLYVYKEGLLTQTWLFKDIDNTPVYKRVTTKWLGGDEVLSESWTGKTLARYKATLLNSMLSSHGEITLRGETTSMVVSVNFTGLSQSGVAHKFQYNGQEYLWRQGDGDKSLAICTVKTEESNGSDCPKITKHVDIVWYKETGKKSFLELNRTWISNVKDSAQLEILLVMTYCLFAKSIEPHKDAPMSFKFLK